MEHEKNCTFVTSWLPRSVGMKCYMCDVCKVAYFNEYEAACRHEDICKGMPSPMELMVPQFPSKKDIEESSAQGEMPLNGRPILDISPMVQSFHESFKSYQSIKDPSHLVVFLSTIDCIERAYPDVKEEKYYRLVSFRCAFCKENHVDIAWNKESITSQLLFRHTTHLMQCPKCPQHLKYHLKQNPPSTFRDYTTQLSSFVFHFCKENILDDATLQLKGQTEKVYLMLSGPAELKRQRKKEQSKSIAQCTEVPKSQSLSKPVSQKNKAQQNRDENRIVPMSDSIVTIPSPSTSPTKAQTKTSTAMTNSSNGNGNVDHSTEQQSPKKSIAPSSSTSSNLRTPPQSKSFSSSTATIQKSPVTSSPSNSSTFQKMLSPIKPPLDYEVWAADPKNAISCSNFLMAGFSQVKLHHDRLSPFNKLAVSQLHFRILPEILKQPSLKKFRRIQLRCNHCGAASTLYNRDSWYKNVYSVAYSHFCKSCKHIPTNIRQQLISLQNYKAPKEPKPIFIGLKQFCEVVASFYNFVDLPMEGNSRPVGVVYSGPELPATPSRQPRKRKSESSNVEEILKRHRSGLYLPCQRKLPHYGDNGKLAYLLPTDSVPIISSLVKDKALKLNYHFRTVMDNFEFCNEGNIFPGRGKTLALRCQNCKYSKEDQFTISLDSVERWDDTIFICRDHLEKCKCIPVKNRRDVKNSKVEGIPTEDQPLTVKEFCGYIADVYGLKNAISDKDGSVIGVIWGEAKYTLAPYSSTPNGIIPRLENGSFNDSPPTHNLMVSQGA